MEACAFPWSTCPNYSLGEESDLLQRTTTLLGHGYPVAVDVTEDDNRAVTFGRGEDVAVNFSEDARKEPRSRFLFVCPQNTTLDAVAVR